MVLWDRREDTAVSLHPCPCALDTAWLSNWAPGFAASHVGLLLHEAPAQTCLISSHLTPGLCPIHLHFHPAICFLNKTPQCRMLTHTARKGPWSPRCSTSRPQLNYLLFAQSRAMTPFLSLEICVVCVCVSVSAVLRVCSCICAFLADIMFRQY